MWIVSKTGFISVVQDRDDPTLLWVRARVEDDLRTAFPDYPILTRPGNDYLYRALIPREVVARAIAAQVTAIDYTTHAKEEMVAASAPVPGRMDIYLDCWWALSDLQPYPPYSTTPRMPDPALAR